MEESKGKITDWNIVCNNQVSIYKNMKKIGQTFLHITSDKLQFYQVMRDLIYYAVVHFPGSVISCQKQLMSEQYNTTNYEGFVLTNSSSSFNERLEETVMTSGTLSCNASISNKEFWNPFESLLSSLSGI